MALRRTFTPAELEAMTPLEKTEVAAPQVVDPARLPAQYRERLDREAAEAADRHRRAS